MTSPMEGWENAQTMCCTPSSSSSSASYAAELVASSEDLLREILLRVPARNIVCLRAVSRQWLSLIADPEFRRRHVSVHRSPSTVLLHPSTSSAHYLRLPLSLYLTSDTEEKTKAETETETEVEASLSLDLPSARVVQSCNGLLLCRSRRDAGPSPDYYVFNPTTKEYSLIPESGVCRSGSRMAVFGLALAFDPSRSPFYKAVCVRGTDVADYYRRQIEVYSSKDREWRVCGSPFTEPFDMVFRDGVFWNGAVHWLSPSGASLFFDIDREVLGKMPRLPDIALHGGRSRRFRYFGHSGRHLHFFEIYGSTTAKFRVFEMQSDYSGWSLKFDIDLDPMIREFPETAREHRDMCGAINYYAFSVLLLVRGESKEKGSLASIIIHVPGKVLSYDVENKTFEKIYEIPPRQGKGYGKLHYGWLDAYEFIETLAPV